MPAEPSVTSASDRPRWCTSKYSSELLAKSFERPGPKSVSPATNCSGVNVVVLRKCIFGVALKMHIAVLLPSNNRHREESNRLSIWKLLKRKEGNGELRRNAQQN